MEFNSQICTSKEQSERLLVLGLKQETADMHHYKWSEGYWDIQACPVRGSEPCYIPAWSLHRLIEMMPNKIRKYDSSASLIVSNEKVQYYLHDVEYSDYLTGAGRWKSANIYDNIIDCIGWLIIEGYFNKDYLEE